MTQSEDSKIERNGRTFAAVGTALAMGLTVAAAVGLAEWRKDISREYWDVARLGYESMQIAAGEDGIFSDDEKKKYLESMNLRNISPGGRQLYIEPFTWSNSEGVNVILDYRPGGEEGAILTTYSNLLVSTGRDSGINLGFVSKKTLTDYIERHG